MSKFKASTRLTDINSELIEEFRKEYNQISPSKFSLSEAFKQYYIHGKKYVVLIDNSNSEAFRKYNQYIVNLHTNINRVETSKPDLKKIISDMSYTLLKIRAEIIPLRAKNFAIVTSVKPDDGLIIYRPLINDTHSQGRRQFTISFSESEHILYKSRMSESDESSKTLKKQLIDFFQEFKIFKSEFQNPNIELCSDLNLGKGGDYVNKYLTDLLDDEKNLQEVLQYLAKRILEVHVKLLAGSTELLAVINGAK